MQVWSLVLDEPFQFEITSPLIIINAGPDKHRPAFKTELWIATFSWERLLSETRGNIAIAIDSEVSYGRTPLLWAAHGEHEAVVKLLVKRDNVAADMKDDYGETLTSRAVLRGTKPW